MNPNRKKATPDPKFTKVKSMTKKLTLMQNPMNEPDFLSLLNAIGELAENALLGRRYMGEMRIWVQEVFSRIRDSDLHEKLSEAWRQLVQKSKDGLGIELLAKEVSAVIQACRKVLVSSRKVEKKDVLNAAATLMDSLKKDLKLPVAIEITWNAAREAVDVAKG